MAKIFLTEILGTDNIALSRTVINKNFQTVENAINILEDYLDTSAPGASLQVGNISIRATSNNNISDILFSNEGSAEIDGNLFVNSFLNATGDAAFDGNVTFNASLLVSGNEPDAKITIGDASTVKFKLQNAVLLDSTIHYVNGHAETAPGSGIFDLDVSNKRIVKINYAGLTGSAPGLSNVIRLVSSTGFEIGQRVHISITEHGDAGVPIYIAATGFHNKYNLLGTITAYDGINSVDVALAFTGADNAEYQRQWVELIYTPDGWEVYNAHPGVQGI